MATTTQEHSLESSMSLWPQHFGGLNSRNPDSQDDQGTAASGCQGARLRVILGLGLLVALVVAGHWMDVGSDDLVWRDAERIHLVERHGIGTERIAKLALQVQAVGPGVARDRLLSEFDQVLTQWDQSYELLRDGVVDSLATGHSREVESIYCELGSMQWGLIRSGRELINAIRYPQPEPLDLAPHVANVLRFERDNLNGIERLVVQHRRDARDRIAQGQIHSRIWWTLVVAALAASSWWVLRRLVKPLELAGVRLSRSRSELLAARQTAGAVSADHRRLMGVVQNEVRPALAKMLTASDCAAGQSNSPTARQHIDRIDATGRQLLRLLNDLLPNRTVTSGTQPLCQQILISPAEQPSQRHCEESELFA
jgi:hypothetical protein